jgi:Mg2+ and Co2+ transporter CorA
MLVEILRRETALMQLYEQIATDCDDPETNSLVNELKEKRGAIVEHIVSKLNQLRAQGEILDGIMDSYESDPAEG